MIRIKKVSSYIPEENGGVIDSFETSLDKTKYAPSIRATEEYVQQHGGGGSASFHEIPYAVLELTSSSSSAQIISAFGDETNLLACKQAIISGKLIVCKTSDASDRKFIPLTTRLSSSVDFIMTFMTVSSNGVTTISINYTDSTTSYSVTDSSNEYLVTSGDTMTGDLTLYNGGGSSTSPSIIFYRGTETDQYTDWKINDNVGYLKFYNRNGSGWSDVCYFDSDGLHGDVFGVASKATADGSNQTITSTYIKQLSISNTTLTYTKGDGTTSNITIPDTKNTAGSTDTSSKIYLVGAATQAANAQTYSDNEVFATNGVLTAKSYSFGSAATMSYNSTDNCIEFNF